MIKTTYIWILFLLFLTVLGCEENSQKSEEKQYSVNGHFWKSMRTVNSINSLDFVATEVPKEYYLIKQFGLEEKNRDSLIRNMAKERVIEFEIGTRDGQDLFESQFLKKNKKDAVKYIISNIGDDFRVITAKGDTIPCIGVHFESTSNLTSFKRLLLYFDNVDEEEQIQLFYNDRLFGNGTMKFMFVNHPLKL